MDAGDLHAADAIALLDRWITRAQRCRLAPFVKCARTMRERRGLIINALEHGISNGRVEGLNSKVRLLVRRAYGFHSAEAALALVMLAAGPINLQLPHEHHRLDQGRHMTHMHRARNGCHTRRVESSMRNPRSSRFTPHAGRHRAEGV